MVSTNSESINARADDLREKFEALRNPEKEIQFQSYLKSQQPMFGINAGPRKEALKSTLKQHPIQSVSDYNESILDLWNRPEREFQYCAIDTACKYKKYHSQQVWSVFEHLALNAKWWDLTDNIAVNLVGSLLHKDRNIQNILDIWANDSDLWIRRTSLLAHLKHKQYVDIEAVARTILALAPDKQFFIQKAIGWTLREYSKTNPNWVVSFIDTEGEQLSNLAIREGTKYINR